MTTLVPLIRVPVRHRAGFIACTFLCVDVETVTFVQSLWAANYPASFIAEVCQCSFVLQ